MLSLSRLVRRGRHYRVATELQSSQQTSVGNFSLLAIYYSRDIGLLGSEEGAAM